MFETNKWYNYKNLADTDVRYMLRDDTTENYTRVYVIIAMYGSESINMFAFEDYNKAQNAMSKMVLSEV